MTIVFKLVKTNIFKFKNAACGVARRYVTDPLLRIYAGALVDSLIISFLLSTHILVYNYVFIAFLFCLFLLSSLQLSLFYDVP